MTVINGIEIDDIEYIHNEIKAAILNNDPIEETLNVIIVISNPCQYARRFILAREFVKRFETEENVRLYIVELAHGKDDFQVTEKNNPNHLQLRLKINNSSPENPLGYSEPALWHKENMINLGVKKLLPNNWKAFAWIDADVEFENPNWALDTLKVLNGSRDIVQLFSHAVDMDKEKDAMTIFQSFGYQYSKNRKYGISGIQNYWHPGFAWAITRKAYEKIGGLYEKSILGSGDNNLALSLIGKSVNSVNQNATSEYKQSIFNYEKKCINLRLGYVPGVIRHHFHGSKKNRKYAERWEILVNNKFNPELHITTNKDGVLVPTKDCPKQLIDQIYQYFAERNEDEGYKNL